MATDIKDQYLKAAAAGFSAMQMAGDPQEMQIALAMLVSHICMVYELNGEAIRNGLQANMRSISLDRPLLERQTIFINGFMDELKKSPIISTMH